MPTPTIIRRYYPTLLPLSILRIYMKTMVVMVNGLLFVFAINYFFEVHLRLGKFAS